MKRISNLFDRIISVENLKLADKKARKGKLNQYGVKVHIKNAEENTHSERDIQEIYSDFGIRAFKKPVVSTK